jgi:hypothetical protein
MQSLSRQSLCFVTGVEMFIEVCGRVYFFWFISGCEGSVGSVGICKRICFITGPPYYGVKTCVIAVYFCGEAYCSVWKV